MKNILISAGVSALIMVLGFVFVPRTVTLGANPGPDVYSRTFFHDNINVGGGVLATTSQGAATYTAANISNSRLIQHIASAALTATLPTAAALSAVGFLPNVGDSQVVFVQASTTKITLAGNTNVTISSASTTLDISPGKTARLEFVRLGATENKGYWVTMVSN
jgi:hypothetical protein